jgi:hypothetical protein
LLREEGEQLGSKYENNELVGPEDGTEAPGTEKDLGQGAEKVGKLCPKGRHKGKDPSEKKDEGEEKDERGGEPKPSRGEKKPMKGRRGH